MSQRLLMQFFGGTVLEFARQKWGNLQESLCSHSHSIPCSSPPVRESHQKGKPVMPRCPLRQDFFPKLPAHCLHHHNIGQLWPPQLAQSHPPSCPDVDPGYRTVSRESHTKLPVCPHPVENTCQNARKHPVQQN